jgi:MoaA/NifB/PqqE/SkfB family radical SAM enzyme
MLVEQGCKGPIAAIIDLCGGCNSRCRYCADWSKPEQQLLERTVLKQVIQDLGHLNVGWICFSGGEPLLHPDVDWCISYAADQDIAPWLITNGILLSKERLERLLSSGLKCCLLSIDALDPDIYKVHRGVSFRNVDRALRALEKAVAVGSSLDVILNCVITRLNLAAIPALVEFADAKGFHVLFQPYEPRVMSLPHEQDPFRFRETDLPALERLVEWCISSQGHRPVVLNSQFFLKHMPRYVRSRQMPEDFECYTGYRTICLGSGGELYSCWHMGTVGNVYKTGLLAAWNSVRFEQIRAQMRALACPTCWTSCHLDLIHTLESLTGQPIESHEL